MNIENRIAINFIDILRNNNMLETNIRNVHVYPSKEYSKSGNPFLHV